MNSTQFNPYAEQFVHRMLAWAVPISFGYIILLPLLVSTAYLLATPQRKFRFEHITVLFVFSSAAEYYFLYQHFDYQLSVFLPNQLFITFPVVFVQAWLVHQMRSKTQDPLYDKLAELMKVKR